ncbi:hypothetical protein CMK22_05000 [Candidatus Poribacteria bacterium]|nr:hypothetical protein [Candidatus Poribacteria bacterium]
MPQSRMEKTRPLPQSFVHAIRNTILLKNNSKSMHKTLTRPLSHQNRPIPPNQPNKTRAIYQKKNLVPYPS